MVLRKRKIKKFFKIELLIALGFLILLIASQDYINTTIKPPLMDYVSTHIDFLKILILLVFIFCSFILIFIVWWLEWGDKHQKSVATQYISRLVCENYYGNYRKTNVYKAIKTCLSKFSRDQSQDEASQSDNTSGQPVRFIDTTRYDPNSYSTTEQAQGEKVITPDGVHTTYFQNGKVEKIVTYKNNVLDGVYRTYYEDGTLHQERYYKCGKLDGIFKAYDEFGVLYFDILYKDGVQEGVTNIYYKNGVLQYRDIFKDGKRIHRKTYSELGELKFSQKEIDV